MKKAPFFILLFTVIRLPMVDEETDVDEEENDVEDDEDLIMSKE